MSPEETMSAAREALDGMATMSTIEAWAALRDTTSALRQILDLHRPMGRLCACCSGIWVLPLLRRWPCDSARLVLDAALGSQP